MLARAVAMDTSDALARENLRVCNEEISKAMKQATMARGRFNRAPVRKRP